MKVSELIEELGKHSDMEVVVRGYEYGVATLNPDCIEEIDVVWNGNLENGEPPAYGGEHDDIPCGEPTRRVLILDR